MSERHPLQICMQILSQLGEPGQWVWQVGKTKEDPAKRLAYLRMAIAWLREKIAEGGWVRIPVDFETFVESEYLLNKKGVLWERVLQAGREINDGKHTECILTGAIGTAKSTLAIYTQAYQLYVLSCMKDPHKVFDLDPSSEILVVFQSINKELAKEVDYNRFRSMIDDSPYFKKYYPYDEERASDMRFTLSNVVVKPVAGHDTAAIGQNVIGGILDEVNFMAVIENSKQKRDGGTYDQATSNYNSIARRRESRFMQMGSLPGMLCLVSSRNYPGQFTDVKEAEARTNPRIYVYDKRLWQIRPERYCFFKGELSPNIIQMYGEDAPFWFRVFIGDDSRKPRVLMPDEVLPDEDRHLEMSIPIEHRKAFENDLLASLRDIAGVATQAMHPFMLNTDAVTACFGRVHSIASREDCDFVATKVQLYPKRIVNPNEPRFVHIDLALSKDSAGVSVGHVPGFVDIDRGGGLLETLPIIQYDMVLEVKPPKGGEIEFEKIRQLIYTLRDKLHLPVRWVTFDQYQSRDSMQIMHQQGFMTGYQSMDVDTYAYDVTKQAFYDDRMRLPAHPKAMKEMITLEMITEKNKIDHPPNGSKDVSDSIAGVAIGLTRRIEVWRRHGVPVHRIPKSVSQTGTNDKKSIDAQERKAPYHERLYGT